MTFIRLPWTPTFVRQNDVPNPRMLSTAGWSWSNGPVFSPTSMFGRLVWSADTAEHSTVLWNTAVAPRLASTAARASIEVGLPSGQPPLILRLRVQSYIGSTAGGATQIDVPLVPGAAVQRVVTPAYTFQGSEDGFRLVIGVLATTGGTITSGANVLLRNAMLDRTIAVRPYFDGSFPDEIDILYEWSGTVDNSVSVMREPSPADRITPTLPVALPYETSREARTIVHEVLESVSVRAVIMPASTRAGVLEAVFADAAAAAAGLSWFSTMHEFALVQSAASYADMRFVVADGALELEQTDTETVLRIPFREVL